MNRNFYIVIAIVAISFCIAVGLGLTDHETKSLVHLFTAEAGNLLTMGLITIVLSVVGSAAWLVISRFNADAVK